MSSLPESALIIKKDVLSEIVRALLKGYYSFSPKYLTFITNPNNTEKLTPIAQHSPRDRLILDAMARLLSDELEPLFLFLLQMYA